MIVGISWVTRSKEAGKKLDEAKFLVDIEDEDVFAKVLPDFLLASKGKW